jgi:hypothetical protein
MNWEHKAPWSVQVKTKYTRDLLDASGGPILWEDQHESQWHFSDEELQAVSALPELVDALLSCVSFIEQGDNNWSEQSEEARKKAVAALAKAGVTR